MAETPGPYGAFRFVVEINGIESAGFTEVSGLGNDTAVIEYRSGSDRRTRKIPGRHSYQNIVLKRGLTSDASLWAWRKQVLDGVTDRRSGSIIVLDAENQEVVRYNFYEGWPARWEGPTLNSTNNEVAIETLEIAHEGIELAL
jgi:phage tail-like protein